ncbi:MAG: hypothetical protein ACLTGV_07770 [Butyricicoccus sp.]
MAEKICAAAVDAATYAIDKLYSYRVPDELREQVQIGTRVLVPFGFGNKRAEAVVLAFREDAGEFKLKPIVEVLDETPILTAEQLRLAAWMRERLYCTYFDCVHAMLPAGLWFKRNETYTLAPDADLAALRERDGEDGQVLALFEQPGQTLSVSEIRDRLGKGAGQTLDALAGEGILVYHTAIRRRKPVIRPKKCSVWIWKQVKPCRTSAAAVRRGWTWCRCCRTAVR